LLEMPAFDCKAGAGTALEKTRVLPATGSQRHCRCLSVQFGEQDNGVGQTASPELNQPITSRHMQFQIATLMPRYLKFATISEGVCPPSGDLQPCPVHHSVLTNCHLTADRSVALQKRAKILLRFSLLTCTTSHEITTSTDQQQRALLDCQ